MNIKLGWKRQSVKALHLGATFILGLWVWGFISMLFDIEPQKISLIAPVIIGASWIYLSLLHKKQDFNIKAEKVLKQTGVDPRNYMGKENSKYEEESNEENKKAI